MRASKIRKARLTLKEINYIVSSRGLKTIASPLKSFLKRSRAEKMDASELFILQGEIAAEIIICEKQIKIFKKTKNRKSRNNEWLSFEIYRAYKRMLKEVVDGVAFRLLKFNRPLLRQLIAHNQTGALGDSFLDELERAGQIVNRTGYHVILNDLTNFLRYGDLTVISPEGIMIDEVKRTGKPGGDQKKILDALIDRLNKKILKIGDQTAQYIRIQGRPTTFLAQVESIIKKSKLAKEGICAKKVSPYLWVSSLYLPKVKKFFKSSGNFPDSPKMPFNIKDISPPSNSLIFFDQVSPNIAPFSIFPFSEELIFEILIGEIQLKTVINEKELIKSFKGKGWDLVLPSREPIIDIYDTDDIDEIIKATRDPKHFVTLQKGSFTYKMPREIILNMENEFRTVKSIIDISEGLVKIPAKDRKFKMIATGFADEHLIWK